MFEILFILTSKNFICLIKIEGIRHGINLCIQDDKKALEWKNDPNRLRQIQSYNCQYLTFLLEKTRQSCEKRYFHEEFTWNKVFDFDLFFKFSQ